MEYPAVRSVLLIWITVIACVWPITGFYLISKASKSPSGASFIADMPTLQKKENKNAKASTSSKHLSSEAVLLHQKMRRVAAAMARRTDDLMDAAELVNARVMDEGKTGSTVDEVRARLGMKPIK